jgi:serine/threonine protein kinase
MQDAIKTGNFTEAESIGNSSLPSLSLAIPRSHLSLHTVISQGAQATVFQATLHHNPVSIAVKRAYIREPNDLTRFYQEAIFLAHLSSHPHIVTMLGARLLPPDYSIILELEPYNAAHQLHVEGWRPSWEDILLIGSQIADALCFIHNHGIVHRDIKPANILLDTSHTIAKLADFGIAMSTKNIIEQHTTNNPLFYTKPSGGFQKGKVLGTLEYMPPEVLMNLHPHTEASDIFALAVTLNELATGMVPYSDATRDNPLAHTVLEMGYGRQELAAAVAVEGLRPSVRADTPEVVRQLLEACWEVDPALRPSAHTLRDRLLETLDTISNSIGSSIPPPSTPSILMDSGELHDHHLAGSSPSTAGISDTAVHNDDDIDNNDGRTPSWMTNTFTPSTSTSPPTTTTILPQFQSSIVGAYATPGLRDSMEDRHIIYKTNDGRIVFGLFDGHRGAEAAQFLQDHTQQCLIAHGIDNNGSGSTGSMLQDALIDIDDAFRRQQDELWNEKMNRMNGSGNVRKRLYPGSTALLGILDIDTATISSSSNSNSNSSSSSSSTKKQKKIKTLTIANIGDGRAVLCRRGRAVRLSRDHTADDEEERERIINATAVSSSSSIVVSQRYGNWRVGSAGLQVTRSVGDVDMKVERVLTAEAEIHDVELDDEDDWFVIIATDGLWDVIDDQEAVRLMCDTVKQPSMCAQRLVTEAIARGSRDNVTAIVVVLRADQGTAEMVWSSKPSSSEVMSKKAMHLSMDELYDTY